MNHGKHLYLMIGFAGLAGVLWFTGAVSTGWLLPLWLVGCAFMMFFMMRGMGGGQMRGMGGGQQGGDDSKESERHVGHRH